MTPATRSPLSRYLATLLLLILFGLLVFSVADKSPTADEQNHVARGLAYLRTGDLRLSQEHPPGVNAWEAWPLLLDPGIRLPLDSPSWANAEWYGFADELLWRANDRPQAMIFATRVPVMWLTMLLAALVYRWGRVLGGNWGGMIALVLTVFDPNLLAHGRLTTTDMGVTCLSLVAMWALWRALHTLRVERWGPWIVAGLAFGALQLSKFSALVLGPAVFAIVLVEWARRAHPSAGSDGTSSWASRLVRWVLHLLVLYGVAGLVVWAGYGFTWGPIAPLGGLPGPAPAYWSGIASILQRTGGGSTAFLLGRYSESGWWYYFPLAFALKTPLPTLALLVVALVVGMRQIGPAKSAGSPLRSDKSVPPRARDLRYAPTNRQTTDNHSTTSQSTPSGVRSNHPTTQPPNHLANHPEQGEGQPPREAPRAGRGATAQLSSLLCVLLPVLAFWVMAMLGGFNIGYRHILPSLPFLYVAVGWQVGTWLTGVEWVGIRRWLSVVCGLLLLWVALGTLLVTPHYLAFFNVSAGGPSNGYRVLVDSNLDWGQDLPALARTFGKDELVRVSWFGAAHPEAYGFAFHPLPGFWRFRGDPAAYGLNPYAPAPGWYAISATNLQGIKLADRDTYAWFREQKPVGHVGHSVLLYRVEGDAADRAVVLGVPMSRLADEEQALLASGASVRQYDPATGIILPLGLQEENVWFVAPALPEWGAAVRTGPEYVVLQTEFGPVPQEEQNVRFGSYVRMQYHEAHETSLSRDSVFVVRVVWTVEAPPHRAAVSFAHLLDAEGRYLAGWDGLTAPATCWQQGDLIVQDYPISLPADLLPGTYQVELGWYDPYTMVRWPCTVDGEPVGDRLLIREVEIKP